MSKHKYGYGTRPGWYEQAACRGMDAEIFYGPGEGEFDATLARSICSTCPVKDPCRDAADHFGIWGGMSPRQRQTARSKARDSQGTTKTLEVSS